MRYLCKWLALCICTGLGLLTVLLVLPGLFHVHPLMVQGRSMEPGYPDGSVIYIKKADEDRLKEGTAVTFLLADEETLVTHRITEVDRQRRLVYTKGDANELADSGATPFSRIVGMPFFCIPYLGYLAEYLSSPAGKAGILLAVVVVCILSWMDGALQKYEEEAKDL